MTRSLEDIAIALDAALTAEQAFKQACIQLFAAVRCEPHGTLPPHILRLVQIADAAEDAAIHESIAFHEGANE